MSADNWQACCAITLDFEGGNDDDPRDPGGRTSRGILQREWTPYVRAHGGSSLPSDVWKAPQSAIVDIYRTQYWNPMVGDLWPKGVDLCVYDAGVNSGAGRAVVWARAALAQRAGTFMSLAPLATNTKDRVAIIQRYQRQRLSFLEALRNWQVFGKGWGRRVAGIESLATKMALQDAGHPPEVVSDTLTKHAAKAKTKARASGSSGTAATAGTGGVISNHVANMSYVDWGIDIGLAVVATCVIVFCVYTWYANSLRAKALAAAGAAK